MKIEEANEIVARLYSELLGRPAVTDKAGRWGKIQSLMGGMSEEQLRQKMIQSKEFMDRHSVPTPENITENIVIDTSHNQNKMINQVFNPPIKTPTPRTTIMVVTSNIMGDLFPRCLQYIRKYTHREYQLIVVETHFVEDMYNLVRDMNIGLRGALDSDYYVSMNDDMFVTEGWLDALIEPTVRDKKIGIVGGLYLFSDKKTIQHGGIFFNKTNNPSHRFYNQNINSTPEARKECYVAGVTGALILITKDCLRDVGLWDNELFLVYNDPDYCLRAWNKGWKVYYAPKCTTVHLQGQSVNGSLHKRGMEICGLIFKNKWTGEQISKVVAFVELENKKYENKPLKPPT